MALFNPCVHNLVTKRKSAWVGLEPQTSPTRHENGNHCATVPLSMLYFTFSLLYFAFSAIFTSTGKIWKTILGNYCNCPHNTIWTTGIPFQINAGEAPDNVLVIRGSCTTTCIWCFVSMGQPFLAPKLVEQSPSFVLLLELYACSSMNCLINRSHVPSHVTCEICTHHCLLSRTSNSLGFRYLIKLILWAYLSSTCNPK